MINSIKAFFGLLIFMIIEPFKVIVHQISGIAFYLTYLVIRFWPAIALVTILNLLNDSLMPLWRACSTFILLWLFSYFWYWITEERRLIASVDEIISSRHDQTLTRIQKFSVPKNKGGKLSITNDVSGDSDG